MATPHIKAEKGDIAKTVLMPGDPLRSKWIAETFLDDPVLFNDVRGVQGYTGTYKGKKVSVMASGMGIPSITIYAHELFNFFDVENIIRVGTAGMISHDLKLRDIVIGLGACTNSNFANQYKLPGTFAPIASFDLLEKAVKASRDKELNTVVGNLYTADNFYEEASTFPEWEKMGVIACEMETAGLYTEAARSGKKALAICTITDNLYEGTGLEPEERQTALKSMIEIALEIA